MKYTIFAAALSLSALSLAVVAQTDLRPDPNQVAQPTAATPIPPLATEGEVRKVDKDAGKITLKHGPIPNLEMPAMTMVFRVSDPLMLDKVKAGEKVRFAAEKIGGALTITEIEPAQ